VIALFCTGRKHAGENFTTLLDERELELPPPIHMCDGLDRNRPLGHTVIENNCLAHGRRHMVDETDNFPAECQHVLEALGKVFKTDEECRDQALSDDERLVVHQRDSAPVMAELQRWIVAELERNASSPTPGSATRASTCSSAGTS
jgi:transposase